MKNKLDELSIIMTTHNSDFFIFTETWLSENILDQTISLPNYTLLRKDRSTNQAGGGVICYIKKIFSFHIVEFTNNTSINSDILPIFIPDILTLIICVYHPHWNNDQHENLIDTLFDIISNSGEKYKVKEIILAGDLNGAADCLGQLSSSFKLTNLVNFNTRNLSSIDVIYVTNPQHYSKACKLAPVGLSDHCCILVESDLKSTSKNFVTKWVPDYNPSNKSTFLEMLNTINLDMDSSIPSYDIHIHCDYIVSSLHNLHKLCFPLKPIKINKDNLPWITYSIRHIIRKRDIAYRRNQTTLYKHYKKKVRQVIATAKSKYYARIYSQRSSSNDKWKIMKNACNIKNSDDKDYKFSAEEFNKYFISVFINDNKTFSKNVDNLPSIPILLSDLDVHKVLKGIKKSGGSPYIPVWIFVQFAGILCQPLKTLFNYSLMNGVIPNILKQYVVTPVPKIINPSELTEFRPISVSSPILKSLEKFVLKHWLSKIITEQKFQDQFAFIPLKGRGCQVAITVFYGRVIELISKGYYVDAILIDFSKAFDKATNSNILDSLYNLGASRECINWINQFLTGRLQHVKIGHSISTNKLVSSGTPQGSIISPVLFACLISSLQPVSTNSQLFKYADDVTLIHWYKNKEDSVLQLEVNNINDWSARHQLTINPTKTKLIHFCGSKMRIPPNISLNDINIEIVDNCNLLGVIISSNLKWNAHVNYTLKKSSKRIFFLVLLRRAGIAKNSIITFYNAMIRSILTYSFVATCNMPAYLFDKLIKFERRCSYVIGSNLETNISSFTDTLCKKFAEKIRNNPSHPTRQLFIINANNRSNRSNSNITVPYSNSSLVTNSFIKYFI